MPFSRAPLIAALALGLSGAVSALDANEVSLLLKNRVSDAVILNIVREQGLSAPLTTQDVLRLNADGASSELLEALTRSGAPVRPAEAAPVTIAAGPPPLVYYQPAAPVYPVCPYPPSYYYGRPHPPFRYGLSFSFGGRGGHHRRHGPGRR